MIPPEKPQIPLDNYLLRLREDIKVIGASSLLGPWHERHFEKYSHASKKLDIQREIYSKIILGKLPVPIKLLKSIAKTDPQLIEKLFKKRIFFTIRSNQDRLPISINPHLAYYIGYLHGDGHIDSNSKRVSFFDKYVSQLEVINKLTHCLFNVNGNIYPKENFYVLDVGRVTINSFLCEGIKIKRGKRESNEIPQGIKDNKILLKWYLCGLFDAEGAMPLNPKKRRDIYIDIAMKDIKLIKSVKDVLETVFGISSYGPYTRISKNNKSKRATIESELRIRKHSEVEKFLNVIGTLHPDKVRRKKIILKLLK
jgi:hypothetical protein